jgi:hypothetical protein
MPYTIPVSFDRFVDNISLSGDHHNTATARKDRIVSLLKGDFEILEAFATGSIPRLTALKAHADLDVIVVLHYGKHIEGRLPSQVLQDVRDALGEYRTGVRKNGQAVTLHYDSWPDVDIVPVSRSVNSDGSVSHYNVPDMNTESWIVSRPRKHANNIVSKAKACGIRFRHIIRMAKHWNRTHSDLMTSYHIEALALQIFSDDELTDYAWEVFQFFDRAITLVTSSLWYEGAYADAYLDYDTRQEVLKRLTTARDRARSAWHKTYGTNNDVEGAVTIWRQIFGDKFPAYG